MKKVFAATLALTLITGQAAAQEAKMDRETIVVSTMEEARDDNWVGVALTLIVFFLIFGGSMTGGATAS